MLRVWRFIHRFYGVLAICVVQRWCDSMRESLIDFAIGEPQNTCGAEIRFLAAKGLCTGCRPMSLGFFMRVVYRPLLKQ